MTPFEKIELIFIGLTFLIMIPIVGSYMAFILDRPPQVVFKAFIWLEKGIYSTCGIDPAEEMNWKTYAKSLCILNGIGICIVFILQILQVWLPLNPQKFSNVEWPLALNTAISFVTNTDWQVYEGERTLSYFTQMVGLSVQNFLSAATGLAVLLALIRGLNRRKTTSIGNFWVDITRTIVYILIPFAFVLSIALMSQGVIQSFSPYVQATTLEGVIQTIPLGPVASQEAIKQLGSNGGGFFNANSAHPFENPTQLSNFLSFFAMLCIPVSSVYMYGLMIKQKKQGIILLCVMAFFGLTTFFIALQSEFLPNPMLDFQPALEGKEMRVGVSKSILWAIATTATSNGSVNSMVGSLSPLAGGALLFQMMVGGIVYGGVGSGLANMLMYVVLVVFLAGLMVGRSPEYLGKKIEKKEIQLAILAILIPGGLILIGSSITLLLPFATQNLAHIGPHGLSEILYAFSSTASQNGSAFESFQANTQFFELLFSGIMLIARLAFIFPSLALAGSLASKQTISSTAGTFQTDNILFGILLIAVIILVTTITFFPALALGPIVEHLLMIKGQSF